MCLCTSIGTKMYHSRANCLRRRLRRIHTLEEEECFPITELDDAETIDDTDQSISDSDIEGEGTEQNPPH
jgi:hypothetical protein